MLKEFHRSIRDVLCQEIEFTRHTHPCSHVFSVRDLIDRRNPHFPKPKQHRIDTESHMSQPNLLRLRLAAILRLRSLRKPLPVSLESHGRSWPLKPVIYCEVVVFFLI